jgi:hypothetical protein
MVEFIISILLKIESSRLAPELAGVVVKPNTDGLDQIFGS